MGLHSGNRDLARRLSAPALAAARHRSSIKSIAGWARVYCTQSYMRLEMSAHLWSAMASVRISSNVSA